MYFQYEYIHVVRFLLSKKEIRVYLYVCMYITEKKDFIVFLYMYDKFCTCMHEDNVEKMIFSAHVYYLREISRRTHICKSFELLNTNCIIVHTRIYVYVCKENDRTVRMDPQKARAHVPA